MNNTINFASSKKSTPKNASKSSVSSPNDELPWENINNSLIQNKCFLCQHIFQKGKLKKVFLVSQLLNFMERLKQKNFNVNSSLNSQINENVRSADDNDNDMSDGTRRDIFSTEIIRSYERFLYLNADKEAVLNDLSRANIAPWMSGLICTTNEQCLYEYDLMTDENKDIESITKFNFILPVSGKGCPPDCGCDNPWPFLSDNKK